MRRDLNFARQKSYDDSNAATKEYFAKYGENQIGLLIIGTDPCYWRHGYAASLCQWGMHVATNEEVAVTLVAGAMGKKLYKHLNFTDLGTLIRQVPGEEEKVISTAMAFDPKEHVAAIV